MEFLNFGQEKLPSVIQDPFSKNFVTEIRVSYGQNLFDKTKWSARGVVEFTNGQTKGTHDFKGESFDEVVLQIKAAIQNL